MTLQTIDIPDFSYFIALFNQILGSDEALRWDIKKWDGDDESYTIRNLFMFLCFDLKQRRNKQN